MRKIIHNKVYDTETARLVGKWHHGEYVMDFDFYSEEMYVKRTGEYFVFGEGGARSPYAQQNGYNSWSGGEAIHPLTYEQARQWAEEHLDAEEYEAEFGTPDEGTCMLQCEVPQAVRAEIDRRRADTGKTIAQIVADAIEATK